MRTAQRVTSSKVFNFATGCAWIPNDRKSVLYGKITRRVFIKKKKLWVWVIDVVFTDPSSAKGGRGQVGGHPAKILVFWTFEFTIWNTWQGGANDLDATPPLPPRRLLSVFNWNVSIDARLFRAQALSWLSLFLRTWVASGSYSRFSVIHLCRLLIRIRCADIFLDRSANFCIR